MIDDGQAVDINGISERALIRHLKRLFVSLNLKEKSGVFLLPSNGNPVFQTVVSVIDAQLMKDPETVAVDAEGGPSIHDDNAPTVSGNEEPSVRRRYSYCGPVIISKCWLGFHKELCCLRLKNKFLRSHSHLSS